ncbi:D-inositol 3-phosphate glycosyltransferase [Posidoniimonas corsicana]|uniref:D-inositol 3-phosphate glycosyltransferase n=1 Tax=Posidoniimonas corsicana TaxID=1938618 RepID=A0A5C5VCK9_9BACT|nr:glycosyltransferase family 4 protein [Posidoniimonas corsicana]TWT36354.1 D-inositol 3-phosphate glycosyltransferase [Posidoniimonas corsicana]
MTTGAGQDKAAVIAERPRVLAIAYACHPTESAESRVGWARALMASQRHDVTVMCHSDLDADELQRLAVEDGADPSIRFQNVPHCVIGMSCRSHDLLYCVGYRMWHRRVAKLAAELHAARPFDVVHQVNFCGFREPGYGWRVGAPFVWGPLGGTQNFPLRFLSVLDPYNAVREAGRNVVNWLQLRFSPRLRRVARRSACVMSATRLAQRDLERSWGLDTAVELEAGLSYPPAPLRSKRDPSRPLRILWTGRLRAWKGLPLLLHALAKTPPNVRCEVRVLGEGAGQAGLVRLAKRLGVDDRIEWVGWGPYPDTLPHYRWADVFAFTSLRDTSGAGLLEALAAGLPIVGIDHQGAADIMSDECAVRLPPSNPREVIAGFSDAITRLAGDGELLLRLSHGATRRADDFAWDARGAVLDRVYQSAMAPAADRRRAAGTSRPAEPVTRPSLNLQPLEAVGE